mgnify:CR=1 FL=1|jgi:hypothetical protein|tara:strand:+ start:2057 stop:2290 length:234 start_codon:yes stop_codon:yes gene_type:complete
MKITKEQLRKIIMEEITSEGIVDVGDETIVTGPDDDVSPEARGAARLEDVIEYLMANEREDLADPLRKIQDMLDALK